MGPHPVQQLSRSYNTMPTESIQNAYNGTSVFRTHSGGLANENFLLQTTIESLFSYYKFFNASFYIFYSSSIALTVLLLKKPSN